MAESVILAGRVVERELRVFRHTWMGSVFSAFLGPVLLLVAMGVGLGELVEQGEAGGTVAGLDYLVFVAPGLLAATAVQTAGGQSLWPVLGGVKWVRTYHGMTASPLRPSDVLVGTLAWNALLVTATATVFLAVAWLLGGVPSPWGVLAVPATVLTAAAVAAPLMAWAATQESDAGFSVIMRMVIAPLVFFSGTVFPIDQLPAGARAVAMAAPPYHGVELARAATTGSGDAPALLGHAAYLVAVTLLGLAAGARTFSRRLGS